ncbi:MAG: hypothetical protein AAF330_03465 [Pseudomonadota bacterium]
MAETLIMIDLAPFGLSQAISVGELTEIAVRAKTKVKENPKRAWSLLSHQEIVAMAWLLDLHFEDLPSDAPKPAPIPQPQVISEL